MHATLASGEHALSLAPPREGSVAQRVGRFCAVARTALLAVRPSAQLAVWQSAHSPSALCRSVESATTGRMRGCRARSHAAVARGRGRWIAFATTASRVLQRSATRSVRGNRSRRSRASSERAPHSLLHPIQHPFPHPLQRPLAQVRLPATGPATLPQKGARWGRYNRER